MSLKSSLGQGWQLGLAGSLTLVGALTGGANDCAYAQIAPDNTLGKDSSRVTRFAPNVPINQITGGATRGVNLFHSFREFNVEAGGLATFINPPGIENILSRVTGGSRSEILGRLSVTGNANLFLINPNGIIFGPNASLDIGGSFVATTANAIQFGNQGFYSASTPDVPPVLTVNPSALLFNQIATQPITNKSVAPFTDRSPLVGLKVSDGKSLLLVGGNVELEGGQLWGDQGGRVVLGGLAGAGTVGLENNLHLSYPAGVQRADVSLTKGARVSASGASGDIEVQGRRVTLTAGSQIVTNNLGSEPGGTLTVTASDSVRLMGTSADGKYSSGLFAQTKKGSGSAGALTIKTGRLIVQDGAVVSTSTFDEGQGGTLVVDAKESVELSGTSKSPDEPQASGLFTVTNGGAGSAGALTIETRKLIVQDGARVSASTFNEAQGSGGTLTLNASESVQLLGESSGLLVGTAGIGNAGDLTIKTGRLIVQDGARVSASTSQESSGKGGSIVINTRELNVLNGAEVTVSSLGSGEAGNLEVQARFISLDNQGKVIATTNSGNGGNITLKELYLLLLQGQSQISTTAGTAEPGGDGGNITIDSDFIIAVPSEDSDITANTFEGKGGSVQITAQGVFGIERREQLTPLSDITAFSQQNPELNGVVEINTPDVDPNRGLVALPTQLVDVTGLIAQGCPAGVGPAASEFVITGRGGLPPNPNEALSSDAIQVDWVALNPGLENSSSPAVSTQPTAPEPAPIVEAQGWVIGANGEVVLTASAPTVKPNTSKSTPPPCHASLNVGFLSK